MKAVERLPLRDNLYVRFSISHNKKAAQSGFFIMWYLVTNAKFCILLLFQYITLTENLRLYFLELFQGYHCIPNAFA